LTISIPIVAAICIVIAVTIMVPVAIMVPIAIAPIAALIAAPVFFDLEIGPAAVVYPNAPVIRAPTVAFPAGRLATLLHQANSSS